MTRDLRQVIEAILAGVVVVDRAGRVEDLNMAACRMLGQPPDALIAAPVEALVAPDHAVARLVRQVLETGTSTSEARQPIARRGGESAVIDVAASPLFDERGRVDGVVLVLRDLSAQRRLEQLETERQRLTAFGRLAAGLAHEVKNPLGGIRGAAELLVRRAPDDKGKEIAELIVREATRIASLVDDFMVFARGDRLRLAPTNVHWVLDSVLEVIGHDPASRRVEVERLYDPSIPEFLADRDRLVQVFLNLARNALQAMDREGGRLRVTTRMQLDHRIALESGRPVPALAVWLTDTGRGMSEEELRQAKTPFFSSRPDGTGLGLAVAEYWIARHQGSVHIESRPGEGTTVRVTLPLRRKR